MSAPPNDTEESARWPPTFDGVEVLRRVIRDHQVLSYIVLSFGWTWTVWLAGIALGYGETRGLQAVGAWGPLLAAGVVTKAVGYDVLAWARQVVPKRGVGLRWYAIAVAAPLALTQTGAVIGWFIGQPVTLATLSEIGIRFVSTLFLAGALEEFGWRGFLQPRLQEYHSALLAAVVIGIVWALWHAPLALSGTGAGYESGELIGLLIGLPLFSIVMAWVYNSTRGGVLFVMLFHAVINTTPVLEAANVTSVMELSELAVLLGLPLAVVLYYGRENLAGTGPEPAVPGQSDSQVNF